MGPQKVSFKKYSFDSYFDFWNWGTDESLSVTTYPLASGGKRTTTFPISAPGSSINFPSCLRPLCTSVEASCGHNLSLTSAGIMSMVALMEGWLSKNLYHLLIFLGAVLPLSCWCHLDVPESEIEEVILNLYYFHIRIQFELATQLSSCWKKFSFNF